ncbi:MAG: slipin family protein [Deltaproteobacteria bacterium]|nr:slipin family protein [Deltaproteobacteria bacterium]
MPFGFGPLYTFLIIVVVLLISGIKILREYERAVIFRLGRMVEPRGPGITYVIPFIEKMMRVDLRTVTMDITPQDVITRDNVSVKVNAVLYFRVLDPNRAIREVENYLFATSQLAQVTLRSVCGQGELDELLAEREKINSRIQDILDKQTDPWGIKVVLVELKHIDLPQEMQRAMAKQAEAERERRAKVIHADGEFQASQRLADAAEVIGKHPMALQLRFLQSLVEVASEKNSTTIFPVPIDLLTPFLKKSET